MTTDLISSGITYIVELGSHTLREKKQYKEDHKCFSSFPVI